MASANAPSTPEPGVPLVVSEKPPIPCLWLDTSVVIKLAKVIHGERLSELEARRGSQLRALVLELVKAGKLICPLSDQEEEIEGERLDSAVLAEFARLSQSARMNHRIAIQRAQIFRSMDAFVRREKTVVISWRAHFYEDPLRAIARERGRQFIATATTPATHPIVQLRRASKQHFLDHMERLRRESRRKRRSFEIQFKLESRAIADEFLRTMGAASDFREYVEHWISLGCDLENLHPFLASGYTTSLPIVKISAQLYADLLTGTDAIRSGDAGDVDLLSTAIPLAHYVLADKRMEMRVKDLGIDKEWGTLVCSMSTLEGLIDQLEALRSGPPS